MPKRILIVTNSADLHADVVADKLAARDAPPFRLNLDEFPIRFALALSFAGGRWEGTLTYLPTQDVISVADIGAVWMRKRGDFSFVSPDLTPHERAYAEAETEHMLFGLLYSLDAYWMSHPVALRAASWKGEQLQRAARMGFAVPPSLITNRRAAVDSFRDDRDIVFKALTSLALAGAKVADGDRLAGGVPTTRITAEHDDLLDAVVELPSFFQQHVDKRYEVRVTVIGERLFAARIDSQADPRTATDYRDFSAEIAYTATELPVDVARRCLEFVHSYGLTYGALDLIVTPDDDHVFLENNPVGQFLFVEQLAPELDMTGALADRLIQGAREA